MTAKMQTHPSLNEAFLYAQRYEALLFGEALRINTWLCWAGNIFQQIEKIPHLNLARNLWDLLSLHVKSARNFFQKHKTIWEDLTRPDAPSQRSFLTVVRPIRAHFVHCIIIVFGGRILAGLVCHLNKILIPPPSPRVGLIRLTE